MSQNYQSRGARRFERTVKNQKYGETRRKYERQAGAVLALLLGGWSVILIALALVVPRFTVIALFAWLLGLSLGLMAFLRIHRAKRESVMYLSTAKTLTELYAMNPLDFEHAVAGLLRKQGYQNVRVTPSLGDGGIDILMEKDGLKYGVQCKKYHPESFVKIDELRAFVYAFRRAGCDRGMYVTTARYGDHGRREMEEQGVILVDGQGIVAMGV